MGEERRIGGHRPQSGPETADTNRDLLVLIPEKWTDAIQPLMIEPTTQLS